ncbi:MAG: pyruvate ferredoxin oxidoreductase [Actinobacteria bacterium]|nr:pyruvate ferredoxin oxidoreductase [Actinomycetota bacterium]
MSKKLGLLGTSAIATAMRQINPDVVAAYPITPQTAIVEEFSQYVFDGDVDTEFLTVESEHSAMSACIGAAAAGARVMTATSSAGLALMWEMLGIASGLRLPVVMTNVNRALSGPINIHCDHSDSMGARDTGWIQIFSENAQEGYDNLIQAVRISEHEDVRLPVMIMIDGFITSHNIEVVEVLDDSDVKDFVKTNKAPFSLLDVKNPITFGPIQLFDFYFETKKQQSDAMRGSLRIIREVSREYEKLSGRKQPIVDMFMMDDAEIAIMVLSSTAGTTRSVVRELRKDGIKAGLIKPRIFRPFPVEDIVKSVKGLKALAVMDRSDSFNGFGGPLFTEVRSSLYESSNKPLIMNYIFGLGGRDVTVENIKEVFDTLQEVARTGKVENLINYLGVRE